MDSTLIPESSVILDDIVQFLSDLIDAFVIWKEAPPERVTSSLTGHSYNSPHGVMISTELYFRAAELLEKLNNERRDREIS